MSNTPEQKAKELIDKFEDIDNGDCCNCGWNQEIYRAAKQCAIIAVEEILAVNHGNAWSNIPGVTIKEFWNQVLTELKK